jgi:hypothetical protein
LFFFIGTSNTQARNTNQKVMAGEVRWWLDVVMADDRVTMGATQQNLLAILERSGPSILHLDRQQSPPSSIVIDYYYSSIVSYRQTVSTVVQKKRQNHPMNSSVKKRKRSNDADGSLLQKRKSELAAIRKQLPVYQFRKEICQLMANNDVLLAVAETGTLCAVSIPFGV